MSLGVRGRPDLHVVARFLDALSSGPRTRSQLQRAVGVNYDIFVRYAELLGQRGYLLSTKEGVALSPEGVRLRAELSAWLQQLFTA